MQKLIPLSTVALNLGIKPETLRRKVRSGQISAYKIGKAWHFSENAIELFLTGCLSSTGLAPSAQQPETAGCVASNQTGSAAENICATHCARYTSP